MGLKLVLCHTLTGCYKMTKCYDKMTVCYDTKMMIELSIYIKVLMLNKVVMST